MPGLTPERMAAVWAEALRMADGDESLALRLLKAAITIYLYIREGERDETDGSPDGPSRTPRRE